jgi:DNA repair protein RecO (recombination protein O)
MIRTLQGFVIRRREITESSLVIAAFTDRAGKLALLAKGALRPKSPFLGRIELFTRAHLTYYENPRRGLNVLSECDVIDPHAGLRSSVPDFLLACSLAELVDMGTGIASRARGVFELLAETLAAIPTFPDRELLKRRFELRLLSLLGYSLQLSSCVSCRRGGQALRLFSAEAGGMVCDTCGPRNRGVVAVSAGTSALLKFLGNNPLRSAIGVTPDSVQAAEAREILRRAVLFYLERQPKVPQGLADAFT